MPVIIIPATKCVQRHGRGRQFDRAVKALGPSISQLRSEGVHNIRELAKRLNDAGISSPSGGPFNYSSVRRVLRRLAQLNLGRGPRSPSTAASQRPPRPYKFRPEKRSLRSIMKSVLSHHEGHVETGAAQSET